MIVGVVSTVVSTWLHECGASLVSIEADYTFGMGAIRRWWAFLLALIRVRRVISRRIVMALLAGLIVVSFGKTLFTLLHSTECTLGYC